MLCWSLGRLSQLSHLVSEVQLASRHSRSLGHRQSRASRYTRQIGTKHELDTHKRSASVELTLGGCLLDTGQGGDSASRRCWIKQMTTPTNSLFTGQAPVGIDCSKVSDSGVALLACARFAVE